MKLTRSMLFASALAVAMGAQAQGMGTSPQGSSPSASSSAGTTGSAAIDDKSFATQAAETGLAEVEMGKLAQQRASDPAVKQFAGELVKAHGDNNKQLETIAKSAGITLPKKLSSEDRKARDELAKLSGSQFDQRFMQMQVEDHRQAVDLFQKKANEGQTGQLQSYAMNTLPHLQSHLDTANKLAMQVGASTSGEAGSSAAGGASESGKSQ